MVFDLTLEYKKTDEYKALYAMIKEDKPEMPDYLVDMAIVLHKSDPKLYRKHGKMAPTSSQPVAKAPFVVEDAINVHDPKTV